MRYTFALVMCLAVTAVHSEDEHKGEPAQQENFFKRAGKQIGHDTKSAVKQAGHTFKEAGKQVGHGTVKALKDIGHGIQNTSVTPKKEASKETAK